MPIIGNRSVLHKSPGRFLNGNAATGGGIATLRDNFSKHGMCRNAYEVYDPLAAIPLGYSNGWIPPKTAGGLSSHNALLGDSSFSGAGALGLNGEASLTGDGTISAATGQLVISMLASLVGSGTITAGDLRGFLNGVANLSGGGTLEGTINAIGFALANLEGAGTASGTINATGAMAAEILAYSALTPEGIRDSIWNASAASYNDTGTMGEKLNASGSASNPWIEVIESGLTAAEILRLIAAAVQGNATGLEDGSPVFKGLDGTTDRITATYVAGTRVITSRDGA
jgi:hypothetical protein